MNKEGGFPGHAHSLDRSGLPSPDSQGMLLRVMTAGDEGLGRSSHHPPRNAETQGRHHDRQFA